MPNPERLTDIINLKLLRSEAWMEDVGCVEGARIWFNLDEMGLHGWADVISIEPCPKILSERGRVVLATVTHFNSFVMEVRLAGVDEILHPTDRHRLYSVSRNAWVPAAQLMVGEYLATKTGIVSVESVISKIGTHRVYNIEVETEHCFYAGTALVLSHNTNPCAKFGDLSAEAIAEAAKNMRKMTSAEVDKVLGAGWHKKEKFAGFQEFRAELKKLGANNPDFYIGRGGEIFLRDVGDATKYIYTKLNISLYQ